MGAAVLKRTMSTASSALLLVPFVAALSAGTTPAGEVVQVSRATSGAPAVTRELARKMRCKYPKDESLVGGGQNSGVECRVVSNRGRHTFYVLKYRNTARAIDFWRDWTQAEEAGGE